MKFIEGLSFQAILKHAHIGVIIHDWNTSIVYINPNGLKMLRLTYEQAIGRDSYDPHWTLIDESGNILAVEDYPVNIVKRNKERVKNKVVGIIDSSQDAISWFLTNAYYEGLDSKDEFIVVTFTDISASKQHFSFQDIVENTQDMVIVTDAKNISYPEGPKIVYVNKAFEKLTGYSATEVVGETPRILQGNLTNSESKRRIAEALNNVEEITETLLNYDASGRPYWVEINIIPLKNKFDEVTHFAAIQRDVSKMTFQTEQLERRNSDLKVLKSSLESLVNERTLELEKAKSELEKIAFFDPLTKIPNRRFFLEQASKLVKSCIRRGGIVAFGLIDIDNFKQINDDYGHNIGDKVLVYLANLLASTLREDDVFCRYGGEEFAFAIIINDLAHATAVAEKILTNINSLKIPIPDQNNLLVTASIGVSAVTPEIGFEFTEELHKADMAMYDVKKAGKNAYKVISD
ncbi:diguanylate cyclase [Glaciecola sp. 2405UD65-10]|uniref:diguanylate cyclase n=1 Tax=Glaciecola sp. 2405UD65-10 TaxID=3397244 RepID=UPI003B5C368D